MHLTDEQWSLVQPFIPPSSRKDGRGRPRRSNREILDGILWILRTAAPWMDLTERYPSYQTCHRRFQEWRKHDVFANILQALAEDMEQRGKIRLTECFIDGTFSSAKKGGFWWGKPSVARGPRSWPLQIKAVYQSPSTWNLLLHMKSPWWQKRLPRDLPDKLRIASLGIGRMTAIRSTEHSSAGVLR